MIALMDYGMLDGSYGGWPDCKDGNDFWWGRM